MVRGSYIYFMLTYLRHHRTIERSDLPSSLYDTAVPTPPQTEGTVRKRIPIAPRSSHGGPGTKDENARDENARDANATDKNAKQSRHIQTILWT
jgi:hypothetical protein